MKVNTKVRYGLRALIAISENHNSRGLLQKEIAEIEEIPVKYLDTIISGLKQAGLIENYAGKKSGYVLACPPKDISVYSVYRAFEPSLTLADCSTQSCKRKEYCVARDFWVELNEKIKGWMTASTIESFNTVTNQN